jgi:hypothetical protein
MDLLSLVYIKGGAVAGEKRLDEAARASSIRPAGGCGFEIGDGCWVVASTV